MGKPLGGRAETRTLLESLQRFPNPLPGGEGLVGPFPRISPPLRPFRPQTEALLVLLTLPNYHPLSSTLQRHWHPNPNSNPNINLNPNPNPITLTVTLKLQNSHPFLEDTHNTFTVSHSFSTTMTSSTRMQPVGSGSAVWW